MDVLFLSAGLVASVSVVESCRAIRDAPRRISAMERRIAALEAEVRRLDGEISDRDRRVDRAVPTAAVR